jgi:hypothetical protein
MRLARPAAVLTVATAAVGIAATSAPAQSIPLTARPHSRVVTHDRGQVHVRRLTMSVARSEQRLHATVELAVRNESERGLRRELRIGRCTGGVPAAPSCPTATTIPVRLGAGQSRTYVARATLREPPARPDAIQAALVRPDAGEPYAYRSDGLLLLTGGAWRGSGAGRVYGVRIEAGNDARELDFDLPLVAPDVVQAWVRWHGDAAPAEAPTALSRCAGAACTATALRPVGFRSRPGEFGNRLWLEREGADALGLTVGAPGQPALLEATLPWPA